MQAIDTNMLYLVVGGFIAIVLVIGLLKSDVFKASVTRDGFGVEAGKHSKNVVRINGIKNNAYVKSKQDIVDNHSDEIHITNVNDATVVHETTKPD